MMRVSSVVVGIVTAATLAACGSSSSTSTGGAAASQPAGHGNVSVLYAGSLVNLMEHDLGPAFTRSDGYGFEGFGAGSTELVSQIKGGIRQGDVFISASPTANEGLEGAANGNWASWYVSFAKSPLVLGYNPHSKFAAQLRSKPWYRVIAEPGIRVGITDPKLDPKGKLTVEALNDAAAALRAPSLGHALSTFTVFPEETLVGRLEAGQLDAGFFYTVEAKDQHIPTVPLTPAQNAATFTVTILKGAPNTQGAEAFIEFLLGPSGRAMLARHGLTLLAPKLTGSSSAVPEKVQALVGG